MNVDSWETINSAIHHTTRLERKAGLPPNSVRLSRGWWLEVPPGLEKNPPWERSEFIARARTLVTALKHRSCHFTLGSALLLHGIPIWPPQQTVTIRSPTTRGNSVFCALSQPPLSAPRAALRVETSAPLSASLPLPYPFPTGTAVDSLEDTALLCATRLPPLDAFVAVSGILRRLSNFDRFQMEASRHREEAARKALLAQLSALPCRNSARALAVISLADAAAESVGERALLGSLLSVSPERPVTQQGWRVNGRHYFSDLYLPSQRAILEFDGAAKMGNTEAEFVRSRREQMQRQLDLERVGLKVLRYQWSDLVSPDQLRGQLRNQLNLPLTGIPQLHRRLWIPNHNTRG